jgi:hypothetical protein
VNTERLIANLSADLMRVPRFAVAQLIVGGLVGGGLVTIIVVLAVLGVRSDLQLAMHSFSLWMKWTYTLSLGVGALYAVNSLARPTPNSLRILWALVIPVFLLAAVGISELARTPTHEWLSMWLGKSWKVCPWLVLALAVPIFAGLLRSFRRLAPTRMRAAGAAAGFAAGAWAATIYCLHCPEVSAIFVLTWYSLGIVLSTAAGAIFGPLFMRW